MVDAYTADKFIEELIIYFDDDRGMYVGSFCIEGIISNSEGTFITTRVDGKTRIFSLSAKEYKLVECNN